MAASEGAAAARGGRPGRKRLFLRWTVRPPSRWPVALRAASAIGVPLVIFTAAGHQTFGLLVGTGAFTVLYGAGRPLRTRLRLLVAVAVSLVVCCALGTLTAGVGWASILLLTVVGMVATFATISLRVGVPGAYFFVLIAGVGGYLPMHGVPPTTVVTATATGAAVAVVVAMSDLVLRPRGPEEAAVARAHAAVQTFVATDPAAPQAQRRSIDATNALHEAWITLADGGDTASRDGMVAELRSAQHTYAAHLLPGDAVSPDLVAEATDAPLGPPSTWHMLRRGFRWPTPALQAALRVGAGVAISGLISWSIGAAHIYWTMAAAMLVLHTGLDRKNTMVRSVHRLVGTMLGLLVFMLVHLVTDDPWVLVAVVIVLQGVVELLVVRLYAAAVMFITPLALTIGTAGTDEAVEGIVAERLVDTAIGVTVAVVVPWVIGRRSMPGLVRACLGRVFGSAASVLDHLGAGTHYLRPGRAAQRELGLDMQELSATAGRGMQDDPEGVSPMLDLREATARLGLTVLARGATQAGPASGLEGAAWACRTMSEQVHDGRLPSVEHVRQVRGRVGDLPTVS